MFWIRCARGVNVLGGVGDRKKTDVSLTQSSLRASVENFRVLVEEAVAARGEEGVSPHRGWFELMADGIEIEQASTHYLAVHDFVTCRQSGRGWGYVHDLVLRRFLLSQLQHVRKARRGE